MTIVNISSSPCQKIVKLPQFIVKPEKILPRNIKGTARRAPTGNGYAPGWHSRN
jgi:hypothetical protein